jgi:hypothetical protein
MIQLADGRHTRIAFEAVCIDETRRQHRPFKPDYPIQHPTFKTSSRLAGFCHPPRPHQIAIARGPLASSTPRGFLPWRLSDDGPRARGIV